MPSVHQEKTKYPELQFCENKAGIKLKEHYLTKLTNCLKTKD